MADISVGSVSVSVVPDARDFIPKLRSQISGTSAVGDEVGRQIGQRITAQIADAVGRGVADGAAKARASSATAGQSSGGAFADAFKARVEAALRDLPNPKVGLDATELDAELADIKERMAALSDVRVGVDLSAEAAIAELDSLKARLDDLGARSPDINVRVDAARASADLAAIQAEVAALDGESVDINVTDGGSIGSLIGEATGLSSVLVGLAPLAIPIGAALTAGLAGVASVAAAAAGGLGVLALGVSGVAGAVKLLGQEQQATATDAARAASASVSSGAAQAAAAASVKSATEALANARRTADEQAIASAEQVATARQAMADAERRADDEIRQATEQVNQAKYAERQADQDLTDAQQQLNDAREQAIRDLQTYADNAIDANLNLQQSQLDLTNAQAQYQADLANPAVTPEQLAQDALNVAKAQQAVVEAQQAATNATNDNNKAQAEGVDGAPGVVDASKRVKQAKHDQQTAEQQLTDAIHNQAEAQITAAETIQRSQQQLTDAIRNQSNQQRQSAYAIETAQNSVANAMRAVKSASDSAGVSGASALGKIQDQLAKVNPATLKFAQFVVDDLEPAFNRLKSVAAAGLLPGVERGLKAMAPLFQPLITFVGDLAGTMGHLFAQAGKALTAPFWTKFFDYVSGSAGKILTQLAHSLENVGKGFAGLIEAFAPVTSRIGQGIVGLTKSFADFGASAGKKDSPFQSFLTYIKQNGPQVAALFGHLAEVIGKLLVGFAPLGAVLLRATDAIATLLSTLSPTALMAIAAAIAAVVFVLVGGPLSFAIAIVTLVAIVVKNWSTIEAAITDALAAIKAVALDVARWFTGPFVDFFTTAWSDVEGAFRDAWQWVRDTFAGLWSGVKSIVTAPIHAAQDVISGVFGGGGSLRGIFNDIAGWVSGAWSAVWGGIKTVVTAPITAARDVIDNIFGKGGPVRSAFSDAVDALGVIWHGLEKLFAKPIVWVINTVLNDGLIKAWNTLIGWIPGVGGNLKIGSIPVPKSLTTAATGAIIPGYAPGVDSVLAMVSPGEAILRPEVARALGHDTINAWNGAAVAGSLPRFGDGGILGGIGGAIGGAAGAVGGAVGGLLGKAKDIAEAIADPAKWLLHAFTGPLDMLKTIAASKFGAIIAALPHAAADQIVDYAKSLIGLGGGSSGGYSGPVTGSAGTNRALGQQMAAARGWTGSEWSALDTVWGQMESGWLTNAGTPSAAYGIPQSDPGSKMAAVAADWLTNPVTQITWGLNYIASNYGVPSRALLQEQTNFRGFPPQRAGDLPPHGYDLGGTLEPGYTLVYNGTRDQEIVAPRQTFEQVMSGMSGLGDVTVYAQFGEETIEARSVRVSNRVIDQRVDGAAHAARQGVPGGAIGALASPHARAVSRA